MSLLTNKAHAIENSCIEHERHGVGVQRLPAEGPHIWAICEVQLSWHHRCSRLVLLQDLLQCLTDLKDHTLGLLTAFGVPVHKQDAVFISPGEAQLFQL